MNKNKDIQKLEEIKYYLRVKEKIIMNSKIKQNKIANQLKKLQITKNNIINNKKNLFSKIVSFIIYNSIMLSILILFLSSIISKFILTPLLTICIYTGVITISLTGAYLSSRLEEKIRKCYYKKKLNIIINKINKKKEEINLENEKQEKELLKQKLPQISQEVKIALADLKSQKKLLDNKIKEIDNFKDEVFYSIVDMPIENKRNEKPYTRVKTKNN